MSLLEGRGITRRFGGLTALSEVDFSVEQGEILGLIGPNGAGKTTLFGLISAALPPDRGVIRFNGEVITGLTPHQVCRKGVARTFQAVKVFPNMPVLANVMVGAYFGKPGKVSAAQAQDRAAEWLEFVGLSAYAAAPARDLTLGNQKMLEVARALATGPELLLLDELMAGLNPSEVSQAMDLVARIRGRGITVCMIEHVMRAIMCICERIIVLHHGEKIAEGTPQEIASSKRVIEVYLGEQPDA